MTPNPWRKQLRFMIHTICKTEFLKTISRTSLIVLALLGMALFVEGEAQAQSAGITSPSTGASVNGAVPIIGTAVIDPFQKYELHYKLEPSGDDAYIYFTGGTEQITDGQLGIWQAGGLAPGTYSLRLRVVKLDGNYAEYYAQNISVGGDSSSSDEEEDEEDEEGEEGNDESDGTPTPDGPTATPIPTATFTPAPQPTIGVGEVGQPAIAGVAPTDTPASIAVDTGADAGSDAVVVVEDASSESGDAVVINPENVVGTAADVETESSNLSRQLGEAMSISRLRTQFFNGVRYSAAIFLIIGLAFVGKRLLTWVRMQV